MKPTKFNLSRITAQRPQILSKRYDLVDGALKKTTAAALQRGRVDVVSLDSSTALAAMLDGLTTDQAITLGVPRDPAATRIVTRRMLLATGGAQGDISRTQDQFTYPEGPGFLVLDHDGMADGSCLPPEAFLDLLYQCVPALSGVQMVLLPSSSSHICRTDTDENLTGSRGLHLYIPVADARDIPRIGQVLFDRMWLQGQGYVRVATNGARLYRTPIDAAVWQPSRLMFAAGAECGPGLEQRRGPARIVNPDGAPVWETVTDLPDLGEREIALVQAERDHAFKASQAEALEARTAWLERRRPELMKKLGASADMREDAETLVAALDQRVLGPEFTLFVRLAGESDFAPRRVGDVLADRVKFHGAITRDPLEPDYRDGAAVGILFLNDHAPKLFSQAHGGTSYRLEERQHVIEIRPGKSAEVIHKILQIMAQDGRFFDMDDRLVTIFGGKIRNIEMYQLQLMLGSIEFVKRDQKGNWNPIDIPERIPKQILSLGRQRELRQLSGVVSWPTLDARGHPMTTPGYHAAGRVYLDFDPEDWPAIGRLDEEGARAALRQVWAPLRKFPFVDSISRGAALAAMFTAALRGTLPTAPMICSDAPTSGSGKTLLLATVASFGAGVPISLGAPFVADPAEMRKKLTSAALTGAPNLLFDNCKSIIDSGELSAFLGAEHWSDRLLTTNKLIDGLSTRMLVGVTGLNLSFSTELRRRALLWRIDPRMENAGERAFDFSPQEVVLRQHKQIMTACLEFVLTALAEIKDPPAHRLASFEEWDRVVRTAVRYAERLDPQLFEDPIPSMTQAVRETEDALDLHELLSILEEVFDDREFSSLEVSQRARADEGSALREALEAATERHIALSARSVGRYLQRFVDRPCGELVLRSTKGNRMRSYHVERLPAAESVEPMATCQPPENHVAERLDA